MGVIGDEYGKLLREDNRFQPADADKRGLNVTMFSSVTASKKDAPADAEYWIANMVSPVRFAEALKNLVASEAPDMLIEVGPFGALAGPVAQVLKDKSLPGGSDVTYHAAWARGSGAAKTLLDVAGRLFITRAPIDMAAVNGGYTSKRTIVDLPNYQRNHAARYWHENAASLDWRNRRYISHDLLGSKIPGTS